MDDRDTYTISFDEAIDNALRDDNKEEFVHLMKLMTHEIEIPDLMLQDMFHFDSANCVAAILAGEAGNVFNLDVAMSEVGSSPLHEAARCGAAKITAVLLNNGFKADTRSDCAPLMLKDELPLTAALNMLRSRFTSPNANGRESAIKLLTVLCQHESRSYVKIVRLLAQNTKEIKKVFFNYLKERKMVEVGALLMAAANQLLSSSVAEGEHKFSFKSIMEMHHYLLMTNPSLINQTSLSFGAGGKQLENIYEDMEEQETVLLLKIFDRVGDKLAAYAQSDEWVNDLDSQKIVLEVVALIQDAGFDVKTEDIYGYDSTFRIYSLPFKLEVMERGNADECSKKVLNMQMLPSWMRETALGNITDQSGSSPQHTIQPVLKRASPNGGRVLLPVKPSTPAVASPSSAKRCALMMGALRRAAKIV